MLLEVSLIYDDMLIATFSLTSSRVYDYTSYWWDLTSVHRHYNISTSFYISVIYDNIPVL